MKRIAELFFLISACLFSSCSEDPQGQADDTGSVYGIVVDKDSGLPVPNVTVELYEGMPGAYGGLVGLSITGNDGSFSFTGISPYQTGHMLNASHAAYIPNSRHISITPGEEIQVSISISPK